MSDRTATAENKQQISSDPRISSPQIKVVYPSVQANQPMVTQPEVILPRTPQGASLSEVSKPASFESTPQETAPQTVTNQTGSSPATEESETAKKQTWLDAIKQHTTLIVVVALTGIVIGYLIAKNK